MKKVCRISETVLGKNALERTEFYFQMMPVEAAGLEPALKPL